MACSLIQTSVFTQPLCVLCTSVPCLISNYNQLLNNTEVKLADPCAIENLCITSDSPPKLYYSPSASVRDRFQDPLKIPKICGCSTPLHKMTQNNAYNQPSTSMDAQLGTENAVFDEKSEYGRQTAHLFLKICIQVDQCSSNLCCLRVNCINFLSCEQWSVTYKILDDRKSRS